MGYFDKYPGKSMTFKTIKSLSTRNDKFTTTKEIVEISCDSCEYNRGLLNYSSYASTGLVSCNNPECSNQIDTL